MKIKDIKEFEVYDRKHRKDIVGCYILIKVYSANKEKQIIRVINNFDWYHIDILKVFTDEELVNFGIKECKCECLGGGNLKIDTEEHIVYFWDKSEQFGEAPTNTVETILKKVFSDFEIKNKNPWY